MLGWGNLVRGSVCPEGHFGRNPKGGPTNNFLLGPKGLGKDARENEDHCRQKGSGGGLDLKLGKGDRDPRYTRRDLGQVQAMGLVGSEESCV